MSFFSELTILIVIATLVAFLMRFLRQPIIVGYIITGLIVGPFAIDLVRSQETLFVFSEIGIALLLFIVGLNLTPKTIRSFGTVSLVTGLGQVLFTSAFGWLIAHFVFGFSPLASMYLGVALSFSSTIIILKLLSDKGDMDRLYGKISVGFLLVQDFIAVLLLFLIPLVGAENFAPVTVFLQLFLGFLMLGGVYLISRYVFPALHIFTARSQEMLFLFALAWGLGLATLFKTAGFSLETGALIAGVSLSTLPSSGEIHSRLKPLRDFFIIIFFVLLGAEMAIGGTTAILLPALILSAFVILGNPLILMIIMGLLGYRKKTNFQTGLTVAQISEFSLIVVALGVKLNHVTSEILSLVTIVGIITIFGSTYMIMHSDLIYKYLHPLLWIFERKNPKQEEYQTEIHELILFGHNRIGFDFLNTFRKFKKSVLVVDYDPEMIEMLNDKGIKNLYGDASNVDFLRLLNLSKAEMVVSTIPNFYTNVTLFEEIKKQNKKAIIIVVAHTIAEALDLYNLGINYVIMPHFLGGHAASKMVEKHQFDKKQLQKIKREHIQYLQKRVEHGHEHPTIRLN